MRDGDECDTSDSGTHSHHDESPNLALCIEAQRYFEHHSLATQVLPASLTSTHECMALAGVHHITIAPPLLRELSKVQEVHASHAERISTLGKPLFETLSAAASEPIPARMTFLDNEESFRIAFTRNNNGANEPKLTQVGYLAKVSMECGS